MPLIFRKYFSLRDTCPTDIKYKEATIGYHWTDFFTLATDVGSNYEICICTIVMMASLPAWKASTNSLHKSYCFAAINNQWINTIIPKISYQPLQIMYHHLTNMLYLLYKIWNKIDRPTGNICISIKEIGDTQLNNIAGILWQ